MSLAKDIISHIILRELSDEQAEDVLQNYTIRCIKPEKIKRHKQGY